MRPASLFVSAVGNSRWLGLDYEETCFAVALFIMPSEDATGAVYSVQHTPDGPGATSRDISYARAGTVLTVTDRGDSGLGHGVSTGDDVILNGTNGFDGEYTIQSTPTPTTYTVTVPNAGAAAGVGFAATFRVFPHALLTSVSGRQDGNYAFPPRHIRLNVATLAAGFIELKVIQGMSK